MKHLLFNLLYHIGFIRFWCFLSRRKILILMLHGVMDREIESDWVPLRSRTSRKLLGELLVLAKQYLNFVSLDDALEMISGKKPLVNNACVVTFDDGHLNNVVCALPILRELSIPCTFYPSTKVVDEQSAYWFDRLDYAIQQPGLHDMVIAVNEVAITIDQSSRTKLSKSLSTLIKVLKSEHKSDASFQRQITKICGHLEDKSGKSISQLNGKDLWSAPMSWDDIIECSRSSDVTIGSHTLNHVRLSIADSATVMTEVNESKSIIEKKTGIDCDHFCYPNGDWNDETNEIVREAGYKSAVTTISGFNRCFDDPFELKRISFPCNNSTLYGLFSVTGVFSAYGKFKKSLISLFSRR